MSSYVSIDTARQRQFPDRPQHFFSVEQAVDQPKRHSVTPPRLAVDKGLSSSKRRIEPLLPLLNADCLASQSMDQGAFRWVGARRRSR